MTMHSFSEFARAQGVVFDCDGCLLDSMRVWRDVEQALISRTGVEWSQEMLEEMRSAPLSEVARIIHERYGVMESNAAVVSFVEETMLDWYTSKAVMCEGAHAFLTKLVDAGIPCCVVSSTPAAYLKPALSHVGVLEAFRDVISTQESGLSKQDPRIYELALREMGAAAPESWGFDDSLYAIRVMNGVGMHTVGTYDDDMAGSFEQLMEEGDFAIRSFAEITL